MWYELQVLLAKQALRVRKRVTRNTVKDRLEDLKNIAKRLRFLAIEVMLPRFAVSCLSQFISKNACCFLPPELYVSVCVLIWQPQSTLPDVFLWMLSGGRRVAYTRIPAPSVLFSLVEEEKGKDCGKITTVYMKVNSSFISLIAKSFSVQSSFHDSFLK